MTLRSEPIAGIARRERPRAVPLALWLDRDLVDLEKPVTVKVTGGATRTFNPKPDLETYCLGLDERGDPRLAAPVRVSVGVTH